MILSYWLPQFLTKTKQQKFVSAKNKQSGTKKLNSLPNPNKSLDFNALSEYIGDRPRARVSLIILQYDFRQKSIL